MGGGCLYIKVITQHFCVSRCSVVDDIAFCASIYQVCMSSMEESQSCLLTDLHVARGNGLAKCVCSPQLILVSHKFRSGMSLNQVRY